MISQEKKNGFIINKLKILTKIFNLYKRFHEFTLLTYFYRPYFRGGGSESIVINRRFDIKASRV